MSVWLGRVPLGGVHASLELHGQLPVGEVSQGKDAQQSHEENGCKADEWRAAKEGQKLVEAVGRFLYCAKVSDQDCADEDESGTDDHGGSKCVMKQELGEKCIVEEADGAQGSEHDNGQCADLEDGAADVCDDEDEEAEDPYRLSPFGRAGLDGLPCCDEM